MGNLLMVLGWIAGVIAASGWWLEGCALFVVLLGYAHLRIRYLELP